MRSFFDYRALVSDAARIAANARARAFPCDASRVTALHDEAASLQTVADALRAERRAFSMGGAGADPTRAALGRDLRARVAAAESAETAARVALEAAAAALPNDTHPASPVGPERAARVLGTVGTPRSFNDFVPADHVALGARLGLFDWDGAVTSAGSGFASFSDAGVRLELAIVQWALSRAAAAGFSLRAPPDIARRSLLEGCGFMPRGGSPLAANIFSLAPPDDALALVGTAEVPLAALRAGMLLDAEAAREPALFAGWGRCFRREAGGAGLATKGLYRLHQFTKVELFAFVAPCATPPAAFTDPEAHEFPAIARALAQPAPEGVVTLQGGPAASPASDAIFSRFVDLQASLAAELGLAARVVDMPTEELGASAFRKVDVEAWMPARGASGSWGEISSASACTDYQARRLGMRYRASARAGDVKFLHTLNATAAAVPRLVLALLETHQDAKGNVRIPAALRPFLGGIDLLEPPRERRWAFAAGPWGGLRGGENKK